MADQNAQLAAFIRQVVAPHKAQIVAQSQQIKELKDALGKRPRTLTEEIDSIPGRRIFYTFAQQQDFTISQLGIAGAVMPMVVSQDGPFVQTHYPLVMWKPSAPATATNLGQWSPVNSWPLPTQQVGPIQDRIDISYKVEDGGSQRSFQSQNIPGGLLSRPDLLVPLPAPTLWTPSAIINFTPTYEDIFFAPNTVATTGGTLVVACPGYRIVNM